MRISVLLAALLVLCQCAKKDTENLQHHADRSFNLLMERVMQSNPDVEKLPSGMYIEWLRDEPGATVVEDDWLMLDYRGTTFNGQVFSTRYPEEAVRENTFTWRTRYTPHFMAYDPTTFGLSPAEYEALALMSEGDSVRLYIPTKLGFGFARISFAYGYEGWLNKTGGSNPYPTPNPNAVSSVSNVPVLVELSLKDIIKDPKTYEYNAMLAKLAEPGFEDMEKITDSLYFKYTFENLEHKFITEDSTVYVSYTGRFLDDFVLKTNDPLVGRDELRDTRSSYMPLFYTVASPPSALLEAAIQKVLATGKVRYDSEIRIIFTSVWGYGTTGLAATSTNPVVYPYTPLYFDIKTHPWGYDPDATEEEEEEITP